MAQNFWRQPAADPKRQFRWIVEVSNDRNEFITLAAKEVAKPNFEITSTPHKFINHTFYYPGRLEWKPISLKIVDIGLDPDGGVDQLQTFLTNSGYVLPVGNSDENCKKGVSKGEAVGALGTFKISQLDHDGNVLETWRLFNAWISKIDYGALNYGSDEFVEISIDVVYDFAEVSNE